MEFKENQAIYMQIVDFACDQVMTGKWTEGERIPSVRELGILLEVNPNTVMRSYECLQNQEIIYNKRGIGLFLTENARKKIQTMRCQDFIEKQLPELHRNMQLLSIPIEQLVQELKKLDKCSLTGEK